jgi:UDP-2-acetamido-2-deoxy-ribo-hexuluronate aminotransferase
MLVPFLDYKRSFGRHRAFVGENVARVAASGEFILRGDVRELELAICRETGAASAVATASATGAMLLALKVMGVGPGKDVLVPAFGFPSPLNCVLNLGARPVLVDVEPEGGVLNAELLGASVTSETRVVLPMHLGRALADMRAIKEFARAHDGLLVLEDSAVALGSDIGGGTPAGRWGDAGVFSFFPSKPLGGIGDAGMLITDDEELAARCRRLRNHGQEPGTRFVYQEVGWNCRADEIAARFLLMKLETFRASLARRDEIAGRYDRAFAGFGGRLAPLVTARADRCRHTYVVRVEARAALRRHLEGAGIETRPFHPTPLHLHPGFVQLGYRAGDFPVAEWVAARALALPFYPELTDAEVEYVAGKVVEFYE